MSAHVGTVITAGPPPAQAPGALVLMHGRGGSAEGILHVYDALDLPQLAARAPQARNNTWYPSSFLEPLEINQPQLDESLALLDCVVKDLVAEEVPMHRIALLGFSQGACLISEFVARNAQRFGAVMILSGGVLGPQVAAHRYTGDLAGTPVYIAANDPDPHVPFSRVQETATLFENLGGQVIVQRFPGMPHAIFDEEIAVARAMLTEILSAQC